ncbi:hypothetical protein ON010_g16075 [Phytophthora cinnamomi]|nr:hypothetical protein ON010_g16075 [Phytophthora cinnamomi]
MIGQRPCRQAGVSIFTSDSDKHTAILDDCRPLSALMVNKKKKRRNSNTVTCFRALLELPPSLVELSPTRSRHTCVTQCLTEPPGRKAASNRVTNFDMIPYSPQVTQIVGRS